MRRPQTPLPGLTSDAQRPFPEPYRNAFTLIELVIVVALVGIMAAYVAPRVFPLLSVKRESAAFKIAADIRYVRSRAMGEQAVHGVQFLIHPQNTYIAFKSSTSNVIADPARPGIPLSVIFNAGEFVGITLTAVNIGGSNEIRFDGSGTPLNASGTPINAAGIITLSYTGQTSTLQITPLTGRVTIQ